MLQKKQIIVLLKQFIETTFNVTEETDLSCDLFEEGYIDSLGLTKLISFLENEFNITIEESNLFDERFLTIEGQSEIIMELMESCQQ
ncbi:MAG: hypothetical protein OMM_13748 [Candidatus Magnetoglobus multicellularis str. Araruama]|uniref:Carrier domain-containing protein n=1 Tax=Candidatus Magnetoglobus multicellularis str. Araruama TaxID=890399 RepID=A0A1V1NT71_9BACT|nr:MAG: hypothetical protein OMM_13748 [Candidatus Magnetoglobus multicellularis str. Araruama]